MASEEEIRQEERERAAGEKALAEMRKLQEDIRKSQGK